MDVSKKVGEGRRSLCVFRRSTSTTTTKVNTDASGTNESSAASRFASDRPMLLFLWSPHDSGPASPPFSDSYFAAVTDFTEMVSPLAVPVTLASSQASLLRLSSAA